MANITVTANIIANPEKAEHVKKELLTLAGATRGDEGCVRYDVFQDTKNPAHFMIHETWESHDLWQKHLGYQHSKDYMAATKDAVEGFVINEFNLMYSSATSGGDV